MSRLSNILEYRNDLLKEDIIYLLSRNSSDDLEHIQSKALDILYSNIGKGVSLRGLIEISNICSCDCFYCGIRKSNQKIKRYFLADDDIISAVREAAQKGFGSIVLQSGELNNKNFTSHITDLIKEIKEITRSTYLPKGLGITLCCGEQSRETFQEWFDAGAHRYLLRIESSNEDLFRKYHPKSQTHSNRLSCLKMLSDIGYQTGTGVIIGFPEQSIENLADDILFFRDMDIDMIGMGPYIYSPDTLLSHYQAAWEKEKMSIFTMSMKMIAVARIVLRDVNIAATSALDAICDEGREIGLSYGANVIMPLLTPDSEKRNYHLYQDKKVHDSIADDTLGFAENIFQKYGRIVNFGTWGDSPHYYKK
jgi:biotin synthase